MTNHNSKKRHAEVSSAHIAQRVAESIMKECPYDVESAKHGMMCYIRSGSDKPLSTQDCEDPGLAQRVYDALKAVERDHIIGETPRHLRKTCRESYRQGLVNFIE